MKEITVTEPAFVTRFSCSGSACRDHCCKGWKITLDKTTVKKYLASKDTTIRTIAQDHIILLKKNNSHWGEIKLPSAIDDAALGELEQVYAALLEQLQTGVLAQELMNIAPDSKVKTSLVLQMQDYFRSLPLSRGSVILDHYIQCLLRVLTAEEGVSMEQKVSDIESSLARCLQADEQQKNWAFRNLILYKIWENNFPNQPNVDPLRALYIIVAEYAFIKLLTAASVHERGRLEWDDVTNIVYSFHSRSQHNSEVAANFHRHIETVRTGDDLSMIHLLT
ncbi:hypothetical protein RKG76_004011 [Salmonella enterica]|nr:hypothetical protein [Salmonella enterica]